MILARHIAKIMGGRIMVSLIVLVGILQILDLLEITTDVLDRGLGMGGVAYYALLRLPRLLEQAAPLSVLAGSLFAFAQLAQQSAVTALRSTGMSAYRITAMAAPAALAVVVMHLAVSMVIAPRTDRVLDSWWRSTEPAAERKVAAAKTFRVGADIVVATPADDSGAVLKEVAIYRRDDNGRLVQSTTSARATYADGAWTLLAPKIETVSPGSVAQATAATMSWRVGLRPSDVKTLFWGDGEMSARAAKRALEGGAAIRPQSYYETQVQRIWAAPMAAIVMLLLTAPVLLTNFRSGGAMALTRCLGAGLLFLVVDGLLTAVGESGAAPAMLGAWAAPIVFAAAGATVLLYLEG